MKVSAQYKSRHRLGWVRVSAGYTKRVQVAAIQAMDPYAIWGIEPTETWDDLIKAVDRDKDDVLFVYGLHRLAETRRDLVARLRQLRDHRVTVYDCEAETAVDLGCVESATMAISVINGERWMPSKAEARRRGSKGGRPMKGRDLTKKQRLDIWTDLNIPTNDEAAGRIGLSVRTLYRDFGSSGRPAGWPGRKKQE